MPTILRSIAEARRVLAEWRREHQDARLALVPTMGALHAGHVSLVHAALERADTVVASIFVNPLQFGPDEDFDRYPRTFDADVEGLADAGVDFVFAPALDDMYPDGDSQTRVVGGPAANVLDGEHRPGHFDGVLTVVTKLFNIVRPDVAVFGQKDTQQLFLIRRMAIDTNQPIEIVGAPIVREDDGLALSSRNVYLSTDERAAALALSRSLVAAADAAVRGASAIDTLAPTRAVIDAEPGLRPDYVEAVDPCTFSQPATDHTGELLVLLAARVGATPPHRQYSCAHSLDPMSKFADATMTDSMR